MQLSDLDLGTKGLEIGGPSSVFASIYEASDVDNCVFSDDTIWNNVPTKYTLDVTNLRGIPDGSYDFVLASHVLEHVANPIQGLVEMKRVLKPNGMMVVILPENRKPFDRNR